jgi:hypothetical protein
MQVERPREASLGTPSLGAVQVATDAIGRHYEPETMRHPQVRSECMRLAYLIQAFGLATATSEPPHVEPDQPLHAVSPRQRPPALRSVVRIDRTRELAEAL